MSVRPTWVGTIGFGMVSVTVGLTPAVKERDVAFKQFYEADVKVKGVPTTELHPVGRQDYDKQTGEVIAYKDIVRGYEASNGVVVKVDEDELAALAPSSDKNIEIERFVDLDEVDVLFFAKHEYAVPRKGSEKPYALLRQALAKSGKAGLGRLSRRGKESPVLVRAIDGALVVTILNYEDEIKSVSELGIDEPSTSDAEQGMALTLIQAMSDKWNPAELIDQHREKVVSVLEAKAEGKEVPVAEAAPKQPAVTDLMAALQASVEKAKKH